MMVLKTDEWVRRGKEKAEKTYSDEEWQLIGIGSLVSKETAKALHNMMKLAFERGYLHGVFDASEEITMARKAGGE